MSRSYIDRPIPIAALATPPGSGALAVLRTSGPGAIELAASCFSRPEALRAAPGHSLVRGSFIDPESGDMVDDVLAAVFRAPRSYTGEDSVEFSCHGSPAVARRVLSVLESAGFAPALPGEFTFRAFASGKLDLVRAEAVRELSSASSEAARRDALARLSGRLSSEFSALRDKIVDLLAEIEVRLDYPEDEGPEAPAGWAPGLAAALSRVESLIASHAAGRLRDEGALVVAAGRPNAGKSSLFNLLLREERAIVSPEPGTTRDWIEAWIELGGMALRLADTAGLREAESEIESAGVSRSRDLVGRADVVVYLADGRGGADAADMEFLARHPDAIRVWNKTDLPDCAPVPEGWIGVSAATGAGLRGLERAISDRITQAAGGAASAAEAEIRVASRRQKSLLDACAASLRDALRDLDAGAPLDSLAVCVREAADRLGEITGEISGEEVFERIFGSFCLGK